MLAQALDEMKAFYQGQAKRFSTHLLWFNTFLDRTDTVKLADRERLKRKMSDLDSILRESSYVVKIHEEGRVEGREATLKEAVLTVVEARFPTLVELAQQRVVHATQPEVLKQTLKLVSSAPDEKMARLVLDSLAA